MIYEQICTRKRRRRSSEASNTTAASTVQDPHQLSSIFKTIRRTLAKINPILTTRRTSSIPPSNRPRRPSPLPQSLHTSRLHFHQHHPLRPRKFPRSTSKTRHLPHRAATPPRTQPKPYREHKHPHRQRFNHPSTLTVGQIRARQLDPRTRERRRSDQQRHFRHLLGHEPVLGAVREAGAILGALLWGVCGFTWWRSGRGQGGWPGERSLSRETTETA